MENMKVKKGFIKKVGPKLNSWDDIKDALYSLFKGKLLAMYVVDNVVHRLKTVDQPYNTEMYSEVTEILSQSISNITDRKVKLSKLFFDNGELALQFVNDVQIMMLPGDAWKTGQMVTIDPFGIKLEPYVERQICSNGAVRAVPTGEYTLNHGKAHEATMLFTKKIGTTDRKVVEDLKHGIDLAKRYNASVAEFYRFRSHFESCINSTEIQKVLAPGGMFDDNKILTAYGTEIFEKSDKWRATANAGVNAYDLLNNVTYIASRPVDFGITATAALEAQRLAAKVLMSTPDMSHVAPNVSI